MWQNTASVHSDSINSLTAVTFTFLANSLISCNNESHRKKIDFQQSYSGNNLYNWFDICQVLGNVAMLSEIWWSITKTKKKNKKKPTLTNSMGKLVIPVDR